MVVKIFNNLIWIKNWAAELKHLFVNCFKLIIFFHKRISIPPTYRNAFVIGNGPSFVSFYENHKNSEKFMGSEKFVCNGFVNTEFYGILKPENYVLSDPLFFDLAQEWHLNVWKKIFENTDWELTIWTSEYNEGKIKKIIDLLPPNTKISIRNFFPIRFHGKYMYRFFGQNLGKISGVTVSHFMLQIAILKLSKNIFLIGIDHDGIENYNYDSDFNKVYFDERHINSFNRRYFGDEDNELNLLNELEAYVELLKGYNELLEFSVNKNLKIYRVGKSYIHFIPFLKFN
jgi:hypothetical protein